MRSQNAGTSDRESQEPRHESGQAQKPADGMQKRDERNAAPGQQPPKQTPGSGGQTSDAKSSPKPAPKSPSGSPDSRGTDRSASNPKDVEDELNEPDGYDDDPSWQKGGKSGGRDQADGRQ